MPSKFMPKKTVSFAIPSPDGQSVGIVHAQKFHFDNPITLSCGTTLPCFDLMVETYGNPNNPPILICHALSGNHHAAGFYDNDKRAGWWEHLIGKGRAIDTERFFVVCLNNLGSCYGSTGPTSLDAHGNIYGANFPLVTIQDWVNSQAMLAKRLGIARWHAVIGGSMGGMQVLDWAIRYPQQVAHAIIIASTPKLSTQNIAFNEVARQSILSDPDFCDGHYLAQGRMPKRGLALARMLGHITYLTDSAMREKFGRELKHGKLNFDFGAEFEIESYLRYQGQSFSNRFDANSYLLMTKALDYFDPAGDDLVQAVASVQARILVVSFDSDWRFTPVQSQELVDALILAQKSVSYINVSAPFGHDSFLFAIPRYVKAVSAFLQAHI